MKLWKGVYPYKYMDDWEKLIKMLLHEKEDFYSSFNMEYVTDADSKQAKIVWKKFGIKNLKVNAET